MLVNRGQSTGARRGQAWSLHVISLCVRAVRQPLRAKEVGCRSGSRGGECLAGSYRGGTSRSRGAGLLPGGAGRPAGAPLPARCGRRPGTTSTSCSRPRRCSSPRWSCWRTATFGRGRAPRWSSSSARCCRPLPCSLHPAHPMTTTATSGTRRCSWPASTRTATRRPPPNSPGCATGPCSRSGVGAPSPWTAPARGSTGRPSGPSTRRSHRVPSTRSGSRRGVGAGISCPCRSPPPWARSWSPGCCRAGPWHAAGRCGTPLSGPGARSRSRSSATTPTSTGWP